MASDESDEVASRRAIHCQINMERLTSPTPPTTPPTRCCDIVSRMAPIPSTTTVTQNASVQNGPMPVELLRRVAIGVSEFGALGPAFLLASATTTVTLSEPPIGEDAVSTVVIEVEVVELVPFPLVVPFGPFFPTIVELEVEVVPFKPSFFPVK